MIPQREYFDKDIANSDNTNGYYIIEENDFVYNPRKSTDAPYGPISSYKYSEAGIVSPLYLCFRAKKEINSAFFEWYFRSSVWHRYVYISGDSGARHDRVSIRDDTFFAMPINLPSVSEQEHIASFLERIDQRIESQRALVESLKKYKRGVTKRIFADMQQWQKCRVSDVAHISTGHSNTQDKTETGKYPFFIRSQTIAKSNRYNYDGEAVLTIGDGQIGKVFHYYNGKFDCHQRVYMMTKFTKTSGKYFYHFFSTFFYDRAIRMSAKNTVDSVRYDMIAEMPIYIPSKEQQHKIAKTLELLDAKIIATEKMKESYEKAKKALLQNLFI